MNFIFHNKLEVKTNNKNYIFFNNVNSNILQKLQSKNSFNDYISIGNGTPSNSSQNKLSSYLKTYLLQTDYIQSDIEKSEPFIKKSFIISDEIEENTYITEIGLSENESDPNLFNYFSCISEELPNGIKKEKNSDILLSITIYLSIEESGKKYLCAGSNKWIEFLLGNGINGTFYALRGKNITSNKTIKREGEFDGTKYELSFSSSIANNILSFNFEANIGSGETHEIVLTINNEPFARINTQNEKQFISSNEELSPNVYDTIDCGKNIKNINSVTNKTTNLAEENYHIKRYAKDFGDKISLPFNNMFSFETPRFVSKDGKYIFFVSEDYVYGYTNTDFQVKQILTNNLRIFGISKIIITGDFVFIFSKIEPYIICYKIDNNKLSEIVIENFNNSSSLSNASIIDVAKSDNNFMIGYLSSETNYATTLYFTFESSTLTYISSLESKYNFSNIFVFDKNDYFDARILYSQEGEYSYDCKLVTHFADKSVEDVYSSLSYKYTKNVKEAYSKDRAVVVEMADEKKAYLYVYFPKTYQYLLETIDGADDYYFSNNLLSVVTKTNGEYKLYSLVGYKIATEFERDLFEKFSSDQIQGIEFLNDTILIFTSNKNEPIVAYNLFVNGTLIENVSSENNSYIVNLDKYNLLGSENKNVQVKFEGKVII